MPCPSSLHTSASQVTNEDRRAKGFAPLPFRRQELLMTMYEVTLPELARVLQQRSEFLKTRLSRVTKTSQLHHDEAILCWDSSGTKTLQARPPHALPLLQASPHLRCALILRMDTTHRRTGTPIGIELCWTYVCKPSVKEFFFSQVHLCMCLLVALPAAW